MIKKNNIDFSKLKNDNFDKVLGISSGGGAIFGAAGGVMESALRTAYETATGKKLKKIEFNELRESKGIREGSININGKNIKFACANGGANIRKLIKNKDKYDFIEMMACPGGCVGGGGQPIYFKPETLKKRSQALYKEDKNKKCRRAHENPIVKEIYKDYLDKPLSKKAEKILHTKYYKRSRF